MSHTAYIDRITFWYDKHIVTPSHDCGDTVVKPAGRYTVKIVIAEWLQPVLLQGLIAQEFPAAAGWTHQVGQPSKPSEELDLINVTISGERRSSA